MHFLTSGAACGRDYAVQKALNDPSYSIADNGFPPGMRIRVITDRHHASIEKAAAVVGIGRENVVDLAASLDSGSTSFAERLDTMMDRHNNEDTEIGGKTGIIVVVSFAEVNTVRLI